MDAHDRAVDHLYVAIVSLGDGVHQPVPDPGLAPAVEAVVGRCVRPISLRQIAPSRAAAEHPEDAVEHAPVVLAARPRLTLGQNRLNDAPLEVRQIVAHDPSSDVSKLESLFVQRC